MDVVEEVKARLNIEDVIGEYVQLKRAGRNYRGLSPFSNEKSPSFMVSPEKQIWHDFSSGKGGNMFSFVMEVEGLEFREALELLARKAGVDIDKYRKSGRSRGPDKERLYDALEAAARFYQVQFSKNENALTYVLKKRQFTKATALTWRLGYSPNNGTALLDFLKSKTFTETEIRLAGLSAKSYRGNSTDMFRSRLMIPLQDQTGRVIGFTARLLDDEPNSPKYINTPQTVLYDKSRHIYGLHLAKTAIREYKYAVLVEGNLDVIASHQAGVSQVVATAGTALTEPHLKTLSRFTSDIRLSFDADKAGVAATERAIPIASRVRVSLGIIDLPAGKDPDELIRHDPKAWSDAVTHQKYALDWLIERYGGLLDLNSAVGKREFSDVLLPVVRSLTDAVERDHYLNQIADTIDVSRTALDQKFQKVDNNLSTTRLKKVKVLPPPDKITVENQKTQDNFLSLMLMRPTLREFMNIITTQMLSSRPGQLLFEYLSKHPSYRYQAEEDSSKVLSHSIKLQNISDYVKIESLLYEELYQDLELNELHYEAARLQARLVAEYVKSKKQKLAEALDDADELEAHSLLRQAKDYDKLLNQVKGASRGES